MFAPSSPHGCQGVCDEDMWQPGSSENSNCTSRAAISDKNHYGGSIKSSVREPSAHGPPCNVQVG